MVGGQIGALGHPVPRLVGMVLGRSIELVTLHLLHIMEKIAMGMLRHKSLASSETAQVKFLELFFLTTRHKDLSRSLTNIPLISRIRETDHIFQFK